MSYKFRQEVSAWKLVNIFFVASLLFLGLYFYCQSQDYINHLSAQYTIQVYGPMMEYKLLGFVEQKTIQPNKCIANGVPVLLYHGILYEDSNGTVSATNFREQMLALKQAGYHSITLQEFSAYVSSNASLPQKPILITFDDGRKDSYYPSDPVLKELGYNAVMFVITEQLQGSDFHLSEKELRKMVDSKRWELGSHGFRAHDLVVVDSSGDKGHFLASRLWQNNSKEGDDAFKVRVTSDLIESKIMLEDTFGITVDSFAVPYSDMGLGNNSILLNSIKFVYPITFYQVPPTGSDILNHPFERFFYKRINVEPSWTAGDLLNLLETNVCPSQKKIPQL